MVPDPRGRVPQRESRATRMGRPEQRDRRSAGQSILSLRLLNFSREVDESRVFDIGTRGNKVSEHAHPIDDLTSLAGTLAFGIDDVGQAAGLDTYAAAEAPAGTTGGGQQVVVAYARGMSWLKISQTSDWTGPGLFGGVEATAEQVELPNGASATSSRGRSRSVGGSRSTPATVTSSSRPTFRANVCSVRHRRLRSRAARSRRRGRPHSSCRPSRRSPTWTSNRTCCRLPPATYSRPPRGPGPRPTRRNVYVSPIGHRSLRSGHRGPRRTRNSAVHSRAENPAVLQLHNGRFTDSFDLLEWTKGDVYYSIRAEEEGLERLIALALSFEPGAA